MSYNGSGTFQINTSGQPVVAGTVISSTAFNALTADLATGLSTAITKDGQTTTTARIPFAQGITSTLTTDSSSVSTGSIITAGGAGIAKNLYVGANANVAGTLGVTGVATFSAAPIYSSLTASSAVATDASKALVSVANTGTGSNVLGTAPTIASLNITTALTLTSASGTNGQVLTSAGSGNAPTWTTVTATAPAFGRVVRTAGSVSTTSTSFVDLTGASITLTTGAFPVHLSFAASWYNDTDNQAIYINADIDGALELGTNGIIKNDTFGQEANASFSLDSAALTAASHTFKIKFKVGGGTGVITGSSANAYNFSVHEIR